MDIVWRMRIACWVIKAKETHSEYVILIPFTLQQWLNERAQMSRYTYVACLCVRCKDGHNFCGQRDCCVTVM